MKAFIISLVVLTVFSTISSGQRQGKYRPDSVSSGKYRDFSSKSNDDGKYKPSKWNKGRYVHMVKPYVHTDDHRELGIYHHIHNPYGGGYGPYSGFLVPPIPYIMDQAGDYKLYTTTTTTTQRPTTTTTKKPKFVNYHEEGGWRILHQQEKKTKKKYDFVYHTENGIYGQERAHVHKDHGLMSAGFYEYTGDDGQIYRVNYKGGKHGFMPEGDHIPKVPEHIRKALEFVEKKKQNEEAQGIFRPHDDGKYVHRDYNNRKSKLQRFNTVPENILTNQQGVEIDSSPVVQQIPSVEQMVPQQKEEENLKEQIHSIESFDQQQEQEQITEPQEFVTEEPDQPFTTQTIAMEPRADEIPTISENVAPCDDSPYPEDNLHQINESDAGNPIEESK